MKLFSQNNDLLYHFLEYLQNKYSNVEGYITIF